jgi:phage shock protein PspC (stress-responsive transcriptional regulator)
MLGGVAAGIAHTYGWDVTLVRLAFVVAALFGVGIPAYVVLWVVIPPEDDDGREPAPREAGALVGLLLLGIGVLWLGGRLVPNGNDLVGLAWPLSLVAGGIIVLVMRAGQGEAAEAPPSPAAPPPTAAEAASADAPSVDQPPTEPATESAWPPQPTWPAGWGAPPASHRPARPPAPPKPPKPPHPSPWLAPLTVSILLLGAGAVALLDTVGAVNVNLEVAGAVALGFVGVVLIFSAWYGRALGLVTLAILLTLALSIVAVVDTPFEGGVGDRTYHPTSARNLDATYRLAIGNLRVDLRDVPLPAGTTSVRASVAIGELHVVVPRDVTVRVHAEAGVGQVDVFDRSASGFSAEREETTRVAGHRTLRLEVRTGAGHVQVDRSGA